MQPSTVDATLGTLPSVHAAGGDVLRVGLVGCGGRGTGAASQALAADPNVRLVAMAEEWPLVHPNIGNIDECPLALSSLLPAGRSAELSR